MSRSGLAVVADAEPIARAGEGTRASTRTAPQKRKTSLLDRAKDHLFSVVMLGAALLAGLYYFAVAAPLYVSEARFAIRGKDLGVQQPLLAGLVGQTAGGIQESIAVRDYILSFDMANALQERRDLRAAFGRWRLDPFLRLSDGASAEDFLAFYRRLISVVLDREANIVTLQVRGFTPGEAQGTADMVLGLSESFINDLSARIREATLRSARAEVAAAREALKEARTALARFRNRTGDLDPAQSGAGTLTTMIGLEGEVTRLKGELAAMLTVSRESASSVQQLRARINALEAQITDQRAQLAGASDNTTLAQVLVTYEQLAVDQEYAAQRQVTALAGLDAARVLAEERERFLVRIVNPNLPMEATEPRRLLSFVLTLILVVVLYGIISFTLAGIRDHRDAV